MNETCQTCALRKDCEYIYVKFCPYGLKDKIEIIANLDNITKELSKIRRCLEEKEE